MCHVAAESIDADLLPMGEDGIHSQPGVRDGLIRLFAGGMESGSMTVPGEVVAIVQLHGLVPVIQAGMSRDDIVSRDPSLDRLGVEPTVTSAQDSAGVGDWASINDGWQHERSLAGQMEEVVLGSEEPGGIVRGPPFEVGSDNRLMASGNVIGDEVDDDVQVMLVDAVDEFPEFVEAMGGIGGVIGADIEHIPDGEGGTGDALEEIGIIGWEGEVGVGSAGGLAEDAEKPEVGDAELVEGVECGLVEVGEFSDAILGEGSVGLVSGTEVGELAEVELIDAGTDGGHGVG
jgi:hypothetical protein